MVVPVPWSHTDEKVSVTISIPRGAADYAVRLLCDAAERGRPVNLEPAGGEQLDRMALETCTRMSLLGFFEDQNNKLVNGIDPHDRPLVVMAVSDAKTGQN